jgi:hypothetical protein
LQVLLDELEDNEKDRQNPLWKSWEEQSHIRINAEHSWQSRDEAVFAADDAQPTS